jgi:hypothetical protein
VERTLDAGDRFGEYVIIQRLASGGMAQVYLARKSGQEDARAGAQQDEFAKI